MPFKTGLVYTYDCGDFGANLERALELAGYAGFEARRAQAARRGRLRGIGIANIIEQTSQTFGETVQVRFDPRGGVTVVPGSISHGQGHETMYKILVSDRLGIDAELIRVARNDTDVAADGGGTFASRTAVLGGSAADHRGRQDHREGQEDRGAPAGGGGRRHRVRAGDFPRGRHRPQGRAARTSCRPHSSAPGYRRTWRPGLPRRLPSRRRFRTFPTGCHVCEVEIDPDTGKTEVLRYSVVDDVGTVINPLTLEGQIHGGIGQGVGQAFSEHVIYDPDSGQLLTGSFMDYGMPRADDMCSFDHGEPPGADEDQSRWAPRARARPATWARSPRS